MALIADYKRRTSRGWLVSKESKKGRIEVHSDLLLDMRECNEPLPEPKRYFGRLGAKYANL